MVREIVIGGEDVGMGLVGEERLPMEIVGEAPGAAACGLVPAAATRHPAFDRIVGQEKLVDRLQRLAEGCGASGRPLPPILLIGPSGGGKTELAQSVGDLMGVSTSYVNCNRGLTMPTLLDVLERMRPMDSGTLDEVDMLSKETQVGLLSILEGRPVRRPARTGRHPEPERMVHLPPLSFVATTTRPGKMLPDLLNRFLVLELEPYSSDDLAEIALRVASAEGKILDIDAAELLAGSCFGIPREVRKRTEELCLTSDTLEIARAEVVRFLFSRGIHSGGWSAIHHRLLDLIGEAGASRARIYSQAGLDAVLVEVYETQLIRAGLVEILKAHGRMLTTEGRIMRMLLGRMFR